MEYLVRKMRSTARFNNRSSQEEENNGPSIRNNRLYLALCISAILFVISYFMIFLYSFYFGTPLVSNPFSSAPGTMIKVKHGSHMSYNDNRTAFVFGATGTYARTELFKCMTALESLITIGGWGGDVYLLIDDISCLNMELIKSWGNPNIHVVPINRERRRLRERHVLHMNGVLSVLSVATNIFE